MKKSILITGKTGTVGSNLHFGSGFSSSNYDLRNSKDANNIISEYNLDAIIHCAASVGGLDEHLKYKKKLFLDNILINVNTIEAARLCGVKRVLSFLSSCVYSDDANQPYNENNMHVGEPFEDYYPYGHAKRMLEIQSRIYYEEYGLIYNCVIPTNIYGINDDFNIQTGHVVGVLIHKCFLAKKNKENFVIWGDGKQEREFLFTEDVSKLTEWALHNYLDKEPLVFSNNWPITIKEIVELIVDAMKFKGEIVFDTTKPSGQKQRSLSGNKLRNLLPDFQFTPIDEGIKQTVDWFINNYPNVRL